MSTVYRIRWELVNLQEMWRYSNDDPYLYANTMQVVPNSQIPDEHWHAVSRETDNPWDQYDQLKAWADANTGFVRNVVLEQQESQPPWREISDDHV